MDGQQQIQFMRACGARSTRITGTGTMLYNNIIVSYILVVIIVIVIHVNIVILMRISLFD